MTALRPTSDAERAALKTAFKRLVVSMGGVEAAATCTRVGKSQLAEYGAVMAEDRHAPIDVLLDLERIAGLPLVTDALARSQGYLLLPVELPGDDDISIALQAVATGAGQTLADALRALHGDLTPEVLDPLARDLGELVRSATHALARVQRMMGRTPEPAAAQTIVSIVPREP